MKKSFLVFLIVIFLLSAQIYSAEEKKDMVVLFDTSVSVLPIFDILGGHLIHDLVTEHLKEGDNFHLLSFDAEPHLEFSLTIKGRNEEDEIISYISLLKPMGQYTDLIFRFKFSV